MEEEEGHGLSLEVGVRQHYIQPVIDLPFRSLGLKKKQLYIKLF